MKKYSDHILGTFKKEGYCVDEYKKIIVDIYPFSFEFGLPEYVKMMEK